MFNEFGNIFMQELLSAAIDAHFAGTPLIGLRKEILPCLERQKGRYGRNTGVGTETACILAGIREF